SFCASGAPPWITSKGAFSRSAKCQAAASTATIRGEIVIAAATRLIRGKSCVIFGVMGKPRSAARRNLDASNNGARAKALQHFAQGLKLKSARGLLYDVRRLVEDKGRGKYISQNMRSGASWWGRWSLHGFEKMYSEDAWRIPDLISASMAH